MLLTLYTTTMRYPMTHEDAGHYASKHPEGTEADSRILAAIKQKLADNHIACAAAHAVAEDLSIPPLQVGLTIDLMEARIVKCQMGLFGYSPQKSIVKPAENVSQDLKDTLEANLMNGRIPCNRCWKIAADHGLKKMEISAACEALGLKVKPCQLGAF